MQKDFLEKVAKLVHEYAVVNSKDIPFRDYVLEACAMNYCGMYNKTWQCPPGIGAPEELKQKCLQFEKGLVFTTCHPLEDSFDIEGMNAGRIEHEKITNQVALLFEGKKIRILSAEGCGLCKECTYPNAPCRFPEKARSSVEANGISVVELAKDCNIRYKNDVNTVTYFSVILFNKVTA